MASTVAQDERVKILIDEAPVYRWRRFPAPALHVEPSSPVHFKQVPSEFDLSNLTIFAKLVLDFESFQRDYNEDDVNLPPRVLAWADTSLLTGDTAFRLAKRGLKAGYNSFICSLRRSLFPPPREALTPPILFEVPDRRFSVDSRFLIYHYFDPTPGQSRPRMKATSKASRMLSARSGTVERLPDFGSKSQLTCGPKVRTFYIFDCPKASQFLDDYKVKVGFAATEDVFRWNPKLPCDLLTSCLFTPAKVALLWQSQKYSDFSSDLLSEFDILGWLDLISSAPGDTAPQIFRDVEQVLEAIADQIALDIYGESKSAFEQIFRQNVVQSRLFYNFMFASRILNTISMVPESRPPLLQGGATHALWSSFDLQVDRALFALRESVNPSPEMTFSLAQVYDDVLARLSSWLLCPGRDRPAPMELGFLPKLLADDGRFESGLAFAAEFLTSSEHRTKSFLRTQSFPILMSRVRAMDFCSASLDILTGLAIVISNCCADQQELSKGPNIVDRWAVFFRRLNRENEPATLALESAMSCLLLFRGEESDILKTPEMLAEIEGLLAHQVGHVRCLSHLLLRELGIRIRYPTGQEKEEDSLVRATIVYRIHQALEDSKDREWVIMAHELVILLGDKSPIVRKQALNALTQLFRHPNSRFRACPITEEPIAGDQFSGIIGLLRESLDILQYDISADVRAAIDQFFDVAISHKTQRTTDDSLKQSLLRHVTVPDDDEIIVQHFRTLKLEVTSPKRLEGIPDLSPSGCISCADSQGRLNTQLLGDSRPIETRLFDISPFPSWPRFAPTSPSPISYVRVIDERRVLAVSSRSQLAILDVEVQEPTLVGSMILNVQPWLCTNCLADYNVFAAQLLYSTGAEKLFIMDLGRQQPAGGLRMPTANPTAVAWLNWHPNLAYVVVDNNWYLYDTRPAECIRTIKGLGKGFVGGNCSAYIPSRFLCGTDRGVEAYDIQNVAKRWGCAQPKVGKLKQFDVHPCVPFCLALGNSASWCEYGPEMDFIKYMGGTSAQAFRFHRTEPKVVFRWRSVAESFDLKG